MREQIIFNMELVITYKNRLILLLLVTFLLTSCEKICDCAKSTGEIDFEIRSTSSIKQIELYNNIDLVVHIDSNPQLKITAGKNLISEITTDNDNGILRIRNKNNCNWVRDFNTSIIVEVWTPSLNYLMAKDATGDIYFEDSLYCDGFYFDSFSSTGQFHFKLKGPEAHLNINNGPADLSAIGSVSNFYLYGAGYGKLDCVNLHSDYVFVTNKGTNNFLVNVQQLIDANIYGRGNIYYKGNPATILKKEFGQGKLISL
jgi:hypothetical protein